MTYASDRELFIHLIRAYEASVLLAGLSAKNAIPQFVDEWMQEHHVDKVFGAQ